MFVCIIQAFFTDNICIGSKYHVRFRIIMIYDTVSHIFRKLRTIAIFGL